MAVPSLIFNLLYGYSVVTTQVGPTVDSEEGKDLPLAPEACCELLGHYQLVLLLYRLMLWSIHDIFHDLFFLNCGLFAVIQRHAL